VALGEQGIVERGDEDGFDELLVRCGRNEVA